MDYVTRPDLGLVLFLNAVLMTLLCNFIDAHVKHGQDCFKDFGESFQRVDVSFYRCWPKGEVLFSCYPGTAIPSWYDRGDTDPCLCIQVYSKAKRRRAHICPPAPSKKRAFLEDTFDLGANDLDLQIKTEVTKNAIFATSTARTKTCSEAFDQVRGYSRQDTETAFSVGLNHGTQLLGHFIAMDMRHCKELCLSLDHCRAFQFTLINLLQRKGFCKGFTNFGNRDNLTPLKGATYFIRRGCYVGAPYTELVPSTTAAVSLATGPMFQFSIQPGGHLVPGLKGGVEQCRRYCHDNEECVAIDYNLNENECWWHKKTSCKAHMPAPDRCCHHYKKHLLHCPYM